MGKKIISYCRRALAAVLALGVCGCATDRSDAPASGFAAGNGTEKKPFLISSAEELRHVADHHGVYFRLNCDITVSDWMPIALDGVFDGGGYSISSLDAPLFSAVSVESVVRNLHIAGEIPADSGMNAVGSLAAASAGKITGVTSTVNIYVSADAVVGGLVGENTGTVTDSSYLGTIEGSRTGSCIGAIVGHSVVAVPDGLPVMITAHAGFAAAGGAKNRAEDNTMDNIIKAVNYGPDAVEVDVQMEDTDGDGIRELWLGHDGVNPKKNPTAEEVLSLLMGEHPRSGELNENGTTVRIQLDSKEDGILGEILSLIERTGFPWERVVLAGDNSYAHVMENIAKIREGVAQGMDFWMNPDFILSYSAMKKDMDAFLARIKALELPAFTVNSDYKKMPRTAKETLDANGIRVSLWTLNDTAAIESQMTRGAYNATSRLPAALEYRDLLRCGACRNTFDKAAGLPAVGQVN